MGTVCSDDLTDSSGDVICREMGYDGMKSWYPSTWSNKYSHITEKIATILADISCSDPFSGIESCTYFVTRNCSSSSAAVVIDCRNEEELEGKSMNDLCIPITPPMMRRGGGASDRHGRRRRAAAAPCSVERVE